MAESGTFKPLPENTFITYIKNGVHYAGWICGVSDDHNTYAVRAHKPGQKYSVQFIPADSLINYKAPEPSNRLTYLIAECKFLKYDQKLIQYLTEKLQEILYWGYENDAEWITSVLKEMLPAMYFTPLAPLTGEDWEWNNVSDTAGFRLWQNNRSPSVFKTTESNDSAYDLDGITYIDSAGTFCGSKKDMPVEFPYTPKRRCVIKK